MNRLVIEATHVFDGESSHERMSVVVDDGVIVEMSDGSVEARPDDHHVDGHGLTVMPGMVITHFHSTYHELGSVVAPFGLEHPVPYQTVLATRAFEAALRTGHTSVVSAGAAHDIDASLAAAIDDGLIAGPRIVPCSRELSTTGHANDWAPWWWDVTTLGATRVCNGAEEFRRGVREEIKRGARMIKLYITGGHGVRAPASQMEMTRDEVAAAIEAAHSRGVQVRAHIANRDAIEMAVELGVDIIDHGDGMDESTAATVRDAGVFVVPSLFFLECILGGMERGSDAAKRLERDLAGGWEMLMMMHEAGIKLTIGDDYGARGFRHGTYNDELVSYVKNTSVPAGDVLRWATRNGADLMRRPDLGAVAEGATADLLVVRGDPIADLSVLADCANIELVIKGGEIV